MNRVFPALLALLLFFNVASAQKIIPGAESTAEYLPMLKGKRVALLINHTSRIGDKLLADTLLKRGVRITTIFAPEHGFRGAGDAGAHIANGKDSATGLPLISLYGKSKKPSAEHLKNVDIVVYDIQDVGVRFYTYISTLQYMMEACAEQGKHLIILDRPNPNGNYVDGPVLDTAFRSFVGMQPIPIVYGMTPGEYARMLVGERWFNKASKLRLDIIKCKGWDHKSRYTLPVAPSPNLRTMDEIYLYPTVCLFEGTTLSVGRGTNKPFQQWGHPALEGTYEDSFMPVSMPGATKPPHEGRMCYGHIADEEDVNKARNGIMIRWLIDVQRRFPANEPFYLANGFFTKLYGTGTNTLDSQIKAGMFASQIKESWQPGIAAFKAIRRKYLLYKDFE